MAKDPVKRGSPLFAPVKPGRQRHLACADTLDSADVIDRIEYQHSDDDGATWVMDAFVTDARAAPHPVTGKMQRPGVIVKIDHVPGRIYRTVIEHKTGKALRSVCRED